MKGKTASELKEIGKNTRFTKENQPENRGPKKKLPALDVLLADVLGSDDESGENSDARAILEALAKEAKKGNVQAASVILNRAYGMPRQPVDHGGQKDNPINFSGVSDEALDKAIEILKK